MNKKYIIYIERASKWAEATQWSDFSYITFLFFLFLRKVKVNKTHKTSLKNRKQEFQTLKNSYKKLIFTYISIITYTSQEIAKLLHNIFISFKLKTNRFGPPKQPNSFRTVFKKF